MRGVVRLAATAGPQGPQRPVRNLLVLLTDEQRADTLGIYGASPCWTPSLDALAERAIVFDAAMCTQPVCTPSRGSILTGLFPHTHGAIGNNIPLPLDLRTLPQWLAGGVPDPRRATAYMGKWHLGRELSAQHGFDTWVASEDMYTQDAAEGVSAYARFLEGQGLVPDSGPAGRRVFSRGFAARLPEALGKPAFLADRAMDFLTACRSADRPFVLMLSLLEPHMPFFGPRDAQVPRNTVGLPPTFAAVPDTAMPTRYRWMRERYARHNPHLDRDDAAGWIDLRARYLGLCALVDTHVGRVLGALADLGLEDDTAVLFTSDHGDMMGDHRLVAKCTQYEGAVHVPLLLRLPGLAPRRVARPVSLVSLVPTLLEAAGCPPPTGLQGPSLLPLARGATVADGEEADGGPAVVVEWNGGEGLWPPEIGARRPREDARLRAAALRTLRGPRWKLTLDGSGDHTLYDLREDPHETRNRIGSAAEASRVRAMAARLRAWQARTGDTAVLPGP